MHQSLSFTSNELPPLLVMVQSLMPFSRQSCHGSTIVHLTAFLPSCKRFLWWLHIAELTLQTVKKTCNCRFKRTKYSAGLTKSIAMAKWRYNRTPMHGKKKKFCRDRRRRVVIGQCVYLTFFLVGRRAWHKWEWKQLEICTVMSVR